MRSTGHRLCHLEGHTGSLADCARGFDVVAQDSAGSADDVNIRIVQLHHRYHLLDRSGRQSFTVCDVCEGAEAAKGNVGILKRLHRGKQNVLCVAADAAHRSTASLRKRLQASHDEGLSLLQRRVLDHCHASSRTMTAKEHSWVHFFVAAF